MKLKLFAEKLFAKDGTELKFSHAMEYCTVQGLCLMDSEDWIVALDRITVEVAHIVWFR